MLRRALLAVVAIAALLAAPVRASSDAVTPTAAPLRRSTPRPYYLVGADGVVLARHQARQRRAIASITKLMTAVVTIERAELGTS